MQVEDNLNKVMDALTHTFKRGIKQRKRSKTVKLAATKQLSEEDSKSGKTKNAMGSVFRKLIEKNMNTSLKEMTLKHLVDKEDN